MVSLDILGARTAATAIFPGNEPGTGVIKDLLLSGLCLRQLPLSRGGVENID